MELGVEASSANDRKQHNDPSPPPSQTSLPILIDLPEENPGESTFLTATSTSLSVDTQLCENFHSDGFVRIDTPILTPRFVQSLNQRLEEVLRGRYSTGRPPKKAPRRFKTEYPGSPHIRTAKDEEDRSHWTIAQRKAYVKPKPRAIVGPLGMQPGHRKHHSPKVLQIINIFQADTLFRALVLHPGLAQCVAQLAGWEGVRLASDQVWAKPPGAGALRWHRDGPYFMFADPTKCTAVPANVVTVWVALDAMDDTALGPLQYVRGSHQWQDADAGRVGAYEGFLEKQGGDDEADTPMLLSRNKYDDVVDNEEETNVVSMLGLPAGAISIHHGLTWHGSPANTTDSRPRRGLGIHYVPANVRFSREAEYSKLWRPYVKDCIDAGGDPTTIELPETDFPVVWTPS